MNISGYSEVTIRGTEEVKALTFTAGDAEVIYKSGVDPDANFYPNIGTDNDPFYELPNIPAGGTLHLTPGSNLTVTGETAFKGSDKFTTGISAYSAELNLEKEATFERGTI